MKGGSVERSPMGALVLVLVLVLVRPAPSDLELDSAGWRCAAVEVGVFPVGAGPEETSGGALGV
ncbi:hypothetical protein EYF80_058696 [Liparis tanakae]|uniref:Uncharacterized protein n=1 Tax=Liparis tanakae TaxID=230148 RepID=A0A4Z2EQT7_9TELE|nr:hypothetical protein EYF80_058696 [Liparis tanakae]